MGIGDDKSAARWRNRKPCSLCGEAPRDGGCFWYVSRQIDLKQVLSAVPLLDFRWAAFAVLVVVLQIPLLGVRWCTILDALAVRNARVTIVATIALSAIGVFFAQVLPSVAGEG